MHTEAAMAAVELKNISKRFGETAVIDDVSLTIRPKEFVVFLGPSGSGKSTLLRMIAGLETIDAGEIRIEGKRVDHLPPGDRGVAMVFQHYALYPHMTVRQNLAFGLQNAHVRKDEIDRRIEAAARMLEISELLERKPTQLSGGQRQRVAIGRAIVKEPKLFLFDEPLSNLDAALRARTRVELARLHREMASTMIFVTHDQVEAMTLADRIVLLNDRRIEQIGSPMEIYTKPATEFVAGFVGTPKINVIPAAVTGAGNRKLRIELGGGFIFDAVLDPASVPPVGPVRLGIRAEQVKVTSEQNSRLKARAEVIERLGDRTLIHAVMQDGSTIVAEDSGSSSVEHGNLVGLRMTDARIHLFDEQGRATHASATNG
ncbi:MAG TPA: sn-glycerol-3-phosphate ABC transporter ATP-binding protein UgpC [Sphingomicrobium sp.]|nr:sn-glycerol-3-phosphate ABC transporter ATP-binding protein UgpC [Sphingomicrobium sp.]